MPTANRLLTAAYDSVETFEKKGLYLPITLI